MPISQLIPVTCLKINGNTASPTNIGINPYNITFVSPIGVTGNNQIMLDGNDSAYRTLVVSDNLQDIIQACSAAGAYEAGLTTCTCIAKDGNTLVAPLSIIVNTRYVSEYIPLYNEDGSFYGTKMIYVQKMKIREWRRPIIVSEDLIGVTSADTYTYRGEPNNPAGQQPGNKFIVNMPQGVFKTTPLTTAAGSFTTFTLENSFITPTSVVMFEIDDYAGTTGTPVIEEAVPLNGSISFRVNNTGAAVLNGVLTISFAVEL